MLISETIKQNPDGQIARAYRFAEKAHGGQKRKSGDPYFNHIKSTAETLLSWHLDETTVTAGLLHDTVEDTESTIEEIREVFGAEVAALVDGVTKLGRIKYRGTKARVENLRKMFLALSEDLRVIFIKLADRLHNMQTLNALPPQKQKRIALETDEVFAPIAYRLGMQNLAGELHDLAFPYLHPQEDRWLKTTVKEEYAARQKYLEKIKPLLEAELHKHGLKPLGIDFRAKRHSSLYQKLQRQDMDIEKIYDLVAMRIIVKDVAECYTTLGVIHQVWPPLPGRIKDYIAMPKPNGYRSLHTTVIGPDERFVEIQVRTQEMHDENENGIAAHWIYQQVRGSTDSKTKLSPDKIAREVKWVQQLRAWQEKFTDTNSEEFLQAMKIDFFKDRIFAITPQGDVVDLPLGSTPVDFAYEIHSDIGNSCIGAKVNNAFVPLDYQLKSGDVVNILTQKGKKPSPDWLEFVKTSHAREHIRLSERKSNSLLKKAKAPSKCEIKIVAEDRVGLFKDVSAAIASIHVNVLNLSTQNPKGSKFTMGKIECGIADKEKIERIVLKIKKLPGVREVGYQII